MPRVADVTRNTNETKIRVAVNLDGSGQAKLHTGIGFFDHMLDQIARHGLIDLAIECQGDLHIDGHHTVEDVGITLGQAVAKAVAAAHVAGVNRAFTVGGAQAVAALAYGTATIPKVDKITGPGNAYVASAKKHVFGTVGIDMIAGPSEILVLADGSTPADWVAMDLFSQAEHDELAQSILLCPDAGSWARGSRAMARARSASRASNAWRA